MMEQGWRPEKDSEPLSFGKLIHALLEGWYNGEENADEILLTEPNLYYRQTARALFEGYKIKWPDNGKVLAVEAEFAFPLINPKTGAKSKTWDIAGKVDVVLEGAIMEHKTTTEDILNPASNYWISLTIDPQITGYLLGAEFLGYAPKDIIYDVIRKPLMRPFKATPVESRKYTKDGSLYANQRYNDETPEEWYARLIVDIVDNHNSYYQRKVIPRIESDIVEYLKDMWSVAKLIMESRNEDFWPRRPRQCFNYGSCSFFPVCSGMGTLEQGYRKADKPNEELSL